ncbi:MAG: hypothetical protein ACR2KK_08115 [Acidimicrobiales bacterium]
MGPVRRLAIPLLVLTLAWSACAGGDGGSTAQRRDGVTVAAFGFSESRILAELYAQAMEARGIPPWSRASSTSCRSTAGPPWSS